MATTIAIITSLLGFASTGTAGAAASAKPRAGTWSGAELTTSTTQPVSFTVTRKRAAVSGFSGEGIVKDGCTNHIQGFQAPTGPMSITRGRFHGVETSYPQKGVRVTVVGVFTSATTAKGRIKIHFKKVAGCDATRAFTATRSSA